MKNTSFADTGIDDRCGTPAGYKAHKVRNDAACDPCKKANTTFSNARRKAGYKYKAFTHCPKGHEYTPENTAIRPRKDCKDARSCKICSRGWAKATKKKKRASRKQWYYDILLSKSCITCGESRPATLQWDHREPELKEFAISVSIGWTISLDRILSEMAKCDVLCANCHAVRTAEQQGWYRGRSGA